MTIFEYLRAKYGDKGARILTAMEARAFGIEFPLKAGWVDQHGATQIHPTVARRLAERLQLKAERSGDAKKARSCRLGATILKGVAK
ncbi:MAG: hypothetical protein V4641_16270 [Pseudomonadota bacterium]